MLSIFFSAAVQYITTSFNQTCEQPLINTTVCDTVFASYQASGCGHSCFTPPGWGGKLCTSIAKLETTTPATYLALGILFSNDGSTFTYRGMPATTSRSQFLSNQFNWSSYTTLYFEDYNTYKFYDNPYVTAGLPQVGRSGSNAVVNAGLHNTGMYFTPDFSTMYFISGFDFLTTHALRQAIAHYYPPNYFGSYTGLTWIKDPSFFALNGNVDENTNTAPYFTCVTHSVVIPPPASFATTNAAPQCDGIHTIDESGIYTCYSTVNGGDPCFLYEAPNFVCLQLNSTTPTQQWWIQ